ncbi:TrmH family RNA methyltransferase [Apilactobacillus kunkeei]|uniref:RNA methyltransferase n=1 Tax=Apilactobacillus kunkeei TaxID=148814 RepID=A0A0M9DD95_9LACO|nr:RNA methyltransferase [Apilactobacillus kunkeei]KOY79072.1 RNA methyltransferase [Apilactobacillus kunkeei]
MEKIVSAKNERVKKWSKLKTKKGRLNSNQYILESWHLVSEAINANQKVEVVLTTNKQYELHQNEIDAFDGEVIEITDDVSKALGSTSTPQGIFGIVELPKEDHFGSLDMNGSWLLLDQIQDPGNIGTMVRTADAAGFDGVIFGEGTSSQFNPKVLRSMQGSQFHLKLLEGDLLAWIGKFKENDVPVYGTELNPQAVSYDQIEKQDAFALVMGNEGNGMQDKILDQTTKNLYIPIMGKAESLNVAIAAGIAMFHLKK